MMIWPPGTRMTCLGPTDVLGSGEAGLEPGGVDPESLGSGEVDGLVDGDSLGLFELADDGPLEAGLVAGVSDAVRPPVGWGVRVAVGLTLGAPDETAGAVGLGSLAVTLADADAAAAADFWLI